MKNKLSAIIFLACITFSLCACDQTSSSERDGESHPGPKDSGNVSNAATESVFSSESPKTLTSFERLFQNAPVAAQNEDELWGYIDITGEYVIQPMFSAANSFAENGLAIVKDPASELWGIIDTSGRYVIEPRYAGTGKQFSDGLLRVWEPGSKIGYINESGIYVVEPQFIQAYDFSNGFARVCSQLGSYMEVSYYPLGYINTSGDRITDEIFFMAYDFSEERAVVNAGTPLYDFFGYIDTTGEYVVMPQLIHATSFRNGKAFGYADAAGPYDSRTVLYDSTGNLLFESSSYEMPGSDGYPVYWYGDIYPVRLSDNTGYVYINDQGEVVLPKSGAPYTSATTFTNGYAAAGDPQTNLLGYIDPDGNWIIEPQYTSAGYFSVDGVAQVSTPDTLSLIDTSGNCIAEYDLSASIRPMGDISKKLFPAGEYAADGTVAYVGYWDQNGNVAIDRAFDQAGAFSSDLSYAKVQIDGKWGVINGNGDWLIPANFLQLGL